MISAPVAVGSATSRTPPSVTRARKVVIKRLRRLKKYAQLPLHQAQRLLRREMDYMFKCPDVQRAAYYRIVGPKTYGLTGFATPIDLFAPGDQPVEYWRKYKSNRDSWRLVCAAPLRTQITQLIAKWAIAAIITPANGIYNWPGRGGCRQMVEDIAHEIESGNHFVWIGDIKACYRSVNFDAVYSLALLPEPIVTNHLDCTPSAPMAQI